MYNRVLFMIEQLLCCSLHSGMVAASVHVHKLFANSRFKENVHFHEFTSFYKEHAMEFSCEAT